MGSPGMRYGGLSAGARISRWLLALAQHVADAKNPDRSGLPRLSGVTEGSVTPAGLSALAYVS
jgi:hypothetical protein